jgi:hypothetical protein
MPVTENPPVSPFRKWGEARTAPMRLMGAERTLRKPFRAVGCGALRLPHPTRAQKELSKMYFSGFLIIIHISISPPLDWAGLKF